MIALLLLKFATASVIESLRKNPELCNFVLSDNSNNDKTNNDNTNTSYGSNCHSLTLPEQQQSSSYISDDIYSSLISEEAEKLYNELTTKLTNNVIASAAAIRASSLRLPVTNNMQGNTYQIEEPNYNNQS